VEKIFAEAVKTFGHVDIVVNNAGTIKRNDSVDFTEAEWDEVTNVNLKTAFLCVRLLPASL
jgi:2-deoxy-D-gluconate 3-dehydrogenase